MITLPTLRHENRIKRLDLSLLSFKTVSPRDLISPKKTPSEKDSCSSTPVPYERSLTTAGSNGYANHSLSVTNRSQSLDAGSLPPVKYEPSKFRPNPSQDESAIDEDAKYALHASDIERVVATRPKNLSLSMQPTHMKELISPQMFGIKGSEIKKKKLVKRRKELALSMSSKGSDKEVFKVVSPKGDGHVKFEIPYKPTTAASSHRTTTGFDTKRMNRLLGLQKIFSARNTTDIRKLLTEESDYMKTEENERGKGEVEKEYSEAEGKKGHQKVSMDLKCFLETKMAWKDSLVTKTQYSIRQNTVKNKKTKHFRMTSVDAIKEFCKGIPINISKAV